MKLCILDLPRHIPGLKLLFPDADYYSTDELLYESTNVFTYHEVECLTDLLQITSFRYDTVFFTLPLLDCVDGSKWTKDYGIKMMKIVNDILERNKFKTVVLFDTYDYDYDPSTLYTLPTHYFKRNYDVNKQYASNVFPFPYMMFCKPCVLTTLLTSNYEFRSHSITESGGNPYWCGTLFTHSDIEFGVFRDRQVIFNQIQNGVDFYPNNLSHDDYLNLMRSYKIGLDLEGVGDPNKRTFELIANNVLILTNRSTLNWGFEDGDNFSEETVFKTGKDFFQKIELLKNPDIYDKCLMRQMFLKNKYMSKDALKKYIEKKLKIFDMYNIKK